MAHLMHDLPMTKYAADDVGAPVPTLNSGLANRLLTRSPFHAWHGHPRLNPDWKPVHSDAFDLGTAVHDVVVEDRKDRLVALDFPDWRTKEARETRDAIRANGKTPLLTKDYVAVMAMAGPALMALHTSPSLIDLGELDTEQTFVWQDEATGAWLRCRPDWVTTDRDVVLSFKTTSAIAEPNRYVRNILDLGYEMQAAFELDGIEAVTGVRPNHYLWIVQETAAPYCVAIIGLSNQMRALAGARRDKAVAIWADCLERDYWPGYPTKAAYVDPPAWAMAGMEELING